MWNALQIAQLLSSIATAVGVVFAASQFVRSARTERTSFTMHRLDRLNEYLNAHVRSDILQFCASDMELTNEDFAAVYWSVDRARIRRGFQELRIFLALVERGRFDNGLLGAVRAYYQLSDDIDAFAEYANRIEEVHAATEGQDSLTVKELARYRKCRRTILALQKRYK